MRRLTTTLALALVAVFSLPTLASADTFFVNTPEDLQGESICTPSVDCSLRGAIERATLSQEGDEIFFALAEGTVLEVDEEGKGSLPAITGTVTIDGQDEGGQPGIAIVGDSAGQPGMHGLEVASSGGVTIRGLAIGGFGTGVEITGESFGVTLCGNLIGTDFAGGAAPNGTGVRVGSEADHVKINGGIDCAGNVIARNLGVGVLVEEGDARVGIYGNSIFANGGLGIQVLAGVAPDPPVIGAVQYSPEILISGTLHGTPDTTYYLDFYANEACDPSGSGEGQTYLQDWSVTTDGSGVAVFAAEQEGDEEGEEGLLSIPPGQEVITATATVELDETVESTSEFSRCFPQPPPSPGPPDPPTSLGPLLIPENGETLLVAPAKGAVFVKLPGSKKFVRLREGQLIPVGAIVDATRGKVTLTSINKAGVTQTAVFYGGIFVVAQREGSGLVTLRLRGALNCKSGKGKAKAKGSEATTSAKRKSRRLWGSGKGRFRTQGNYGSATVRGTTWLTEDRCAGTFFKVRKGSVTVRDFSLAKTLNLNRGKSYLAKP